MNRLLLLIMLGMPFTNYGQDVSTEIMVIEPYRTLENYEHFKRLVLTCDNVDASYIEGFRFQWGYRYLLEVEVKTLPYTLSDGTKYEYRLLRVLIKEPVRENFTFKLFIDPLLYYGSKDDPEQIENLIQKTDSSYVYMEDVEIVVPSQHMEAFKTMKNGELGRIGIFNFNEERNIVLQELQ